MPKTRLTCLLVIAGLLFISLACDKIESQTTQSDKKARAEALEKGQQALEEAQRLRNEFDLKQTAWQRAAGEAKALEQVVANIKDSKSATDAKDLSRIEGDAKTAADNAAKLEKETKSAEARYLAKQAEAEKLLKGASADKAISLLLASDAKARQAQVEYEQGLLAAREMSALQINARRLSWELKRLASEVAMCDRQIAIWDQYDPSKPGVAGEGGTAAPAPLAEVEKAKASFVEKRDAAAATVADLDKKIEEKTKEIEALKQEKATLDSQGTDLLKKAEGLRGKEGLETFKQGNEARQKASVASLKGEKAASELADLQRERTRAALAVEQAKASIDKLDNQSADIKKGGDEALKNKALIEERKKSLIGPAEGGVTIVDISKQINDLMQKMDKARAVAMDRLKAAGGKRDLEKDEEPGLFEMARIDARKAHEELSKMSTDPNNQGSPRIKAWQSLMDAIQPNRFVISRARVLVSQADLLAEEARTLVYVNDALKDLDEVKVARPAEFSSVKDLSAAVKSAETAYRSSIKVLEQLGIADGSARPNDDLAFAARTTAMFVHYRLYHLLKLAGSGEAQAELAKATNYYNLVSGEITARGGSPVAYLPNIPDELSQRPRSKIDDIGTGPTTAPTTMAATTNPTTGPAVAGDETISKLVLQLTYVSEKPITEAIDVVVYKKAGDEEIGRFENVGKDRQHAAGEGDVAEVDVKPIPAAETKNYYVKLFRKGGDSELVVNFEALSGDNKFILAAKTDDSKISFAKDKNEGQRDLSEAKAR